MLRWTANGIVMIAQYERKYGMGYGINFKDLRAVQTIASEDTDLKDVPAYRITSLPIVT